MGIFDEYEEYADPDFNIKTEEDEDFDEENSILLASLDWAPMPETVSWKDPNFSKDLVSRLKGVTDKDIARIAKYNQFYLEIQSRLNG